MTIQHWHIVSVSKLNIIYNSFVWMIKKLAFHMCVCSLHGLIRGENMELGRDSDTGGQVIWMGEKSSNEYWIISKI